MCLFCMNCGQCGKEVPPDVKEARATAFKCFGCGELVEAGVSRCPNCGKPVLLPPGASLSQ